VGQTRRPHARIITILCFVVYSASGLLLMYLLCPPNWESVLERLSRLLSRFSLFANEACAKSLRARITQLVLEYTRTQTHGATHAPTQWQLSHSLFFPFLYASRQFSLYFFFRRPPPPLSVCRLLNIQLSGVFVLTCMQISRARKGERKREMLIAERRKSVVMIF
jgi:hypothetical protein